MGDGFIHLDVSLMVSCCDPAEVSLVAEKLARVLAGLALDGHNAWLDIHRSVGINEDDERVIEP